MSINLSESTALFIKDIENYIANAEENIIFDRTFSLIQGDKIDENFSERQERTKVDQTLTKFYERFLSIIPANPNKENVIEAINSLTEIRDGNLYSTIYRIIDNFIKENCNDNALHLIQAARGNGKSTAQNFFIVNDLS